MRSPPWSPFSPRTAAASRRERYSTSRVAEQPTEASSEIPPAAPTLLREPNEPGMQSLAERKGKLSMKVLVTGGSGFLGQQFIELARQGGHQVVSYDIVEPQKESADVWILGDITDRQALLDALHSHQPE